MSHSTEMLKKLQPFQRNSKIFREIFLAEEKQFDSINDLIADVRLQLSIDTATWALAIYEAELGIPVDPTKPISDRRSVIKSKIRGTGKVDAALIKIVADSYTNGAVSVAFDGSIRITFTSLIGTPPNLDDLKAAIEEIKPAHLRVVYVFRYLTYDELAGMTWGEFQNVKYDQLSRS